MLQFNQILSRYFIKCTIQKIDAKIHIFYYSKKFFYKKNCASTHDNAISH